MPIKKMGKATKSWTSIQTRPKATPAGRTLSATKGSATGITKKNANRKAGAAKKRGY
jgi:hypothetical protein